ncbi:hypothetical protein A3382_004781 [Escherichia coli]|nr:hypothetical protein [Escherichia coli]
MLKITPNFAQERGLNQLRHQWKQHRTYRTHWLWQNWSCSIRHCRNG